MTDLAPPGRAAGHSPGQGDTVRLVPGPPPKTASHPHRDQGHREGLLLLHCPKSEPGSGQPTLTGRGAGTHTQARAKEGRHAACQGLDVGQ